MSWFLNQLVNGILQLSIGVIVFVTNQLILPLGFTPAMIQAYFPIIDDFTFAFKVIAICILIVLVLFQLTKAIFSDVSITNKDNPLILLFRSAIALVLILWSMSFMSYLFNAFSQPFYFLENNNGDEKAFDVVDDSNSVFQQNTAEAFSNFIDSAESTSDNAYQDTADKIKSWIFPGIDILKAIIQIICIVIIGYKFILFLLEIIERYILLMLQVYTSPLIWPTVASSSTISIFKKWLEMFFSNFLLIYLNMWMLGIIVNSMRYIFSPDFDAQLGGYTPSFLLGVCIMYAMLRIAQSTDTVLSKLMNTANTGAGLGQELFMQFNMVSHSARDLFRAGTSSLHRHSSHSSDEKESKSFNDHKRSVDSSDSIDRSVSSPLVYPFSKSEETPMVTLTSGGEGDKKYSANEETKLDTSRPSAFAETEPIIDSKQTVPMDTGNTREQEELLNSGAMALDNREPDLKDSLASLDSSQVQVIPAPRLDSRTMLDSEITRNQVQNGLKTLGQYNDPILRALTLDQLGLDQPISYSDFLEQSELDPSLTNYLEESTGFLPEQVYPLENDVIGIEGETSDGDRAQTIGVLYPVEKDALSYFDNPALTDGYGNYYLLEKEIEPLSTSIDSNKLHALPDTNSYLFNPNLSQVDPDKMYFEDLGQNQQKVLALPDPSVSKSETSLVSHQDEEIEMPIKKIPPFTTIKNEQGEVRDD